MSNYKGIKDRVYVCKQCKQDFKRNFYSKKPPIYCSNRCQHDFRLEQSKEKFKEGKITYYQTHVRLLTELFGYQCVQCGINEWENQPLTLQVDHIDGNPDNNRQDNLRLLCPNCHSQTPTYKGGNKNNPKNSSRNKKARKAYAEGRGYYR